MLSLFVEIQINKYLNKKYIGVKILYDYKISKSSHPHVCVIYM